MRWGGTGRGKSGAGDALGLRPAHTEVQTSVLCQQLIYQVPGTSIPPSFLNLQLIYPEGRGELIMVIAAAHSPAR